jgi:hypothetical protein
VNGIPGAERRLAPKAAGGRTRSLPGASKCGILARMRTVATMVVAGAALTGCVSEAAYQEALRDARQARMEAAERDQRSRIMQSQIDWLAARLQEREARMGGPAAASDPQSAAELARALRELSAWSASFADRLQHAPARPLDAADPWSLPPRPPAGPSRRPGAAAPGGLALAAQPLDDDDPWGSPGTKRPPLDSDDPWRQ